MSDATKQSGEQSGGGRTKFLLIILGLGLVALGYDYKIARPAVETAYDEITERSTDVNADSTKVFTNMDVRKLLGKEPSKTFNDANGDVVEVFSWRSGLPIKTHDLFAVYKPNGGKNLFYRHAKYKYEASGEVSDFSVNKIIEGPAEDDSESEDPESEDTGGQYAGGQSDGGGPGGGQRGGGGFDPEAMFAENDADGDGLLKDDEISDRMRENLDDIDTDGDGAVSKDEMLARFAAMRGRGGRPGGGGGRPDGGSRPPLESESEESSANSEVDEAGDAETPAEAAANAEAEGAAEAEAEGEAETEAEAEGEAETEAEAEGEAETEAEADDDAETEGESKSDES